MWDIPQGSLTGTISLVSSGVATPWASARRPRARRRRRRHSLWSASGEQLTTVDAPDANPTQSVFGIGDERGFMTVLQDGTIDLWDRDGVCWRRSVNRAPPWSMSPWRLITARRQRSSSSARSGGGTSPQAGRRPRPLPSSWSTESVWSTACRRARRISGCVRHVEWPRRDDRRGGRSHQVVRATAGQHRFGRLLGGLDRDRERDGERRGPESFDDTVTIFDARSGGAAGQFGGEAEQVAGYAFFRTRSDSRPMAICLPPTRTTSRFRSTTVRRCDPAHVSIA